MSTVFLKRMLLGAAMLVWVVFFVSMLRGCVPELSEAKAEAKAEMSRRERMADLEVKVLEEQYESMSVEEKMKGIVYER